MSLKHKYFLLAMLAALLVIFFLAGDGAQHFQKLMFTIQQQQNALQRTMSKTLAALRHGNDPAAWWALISLGLSYGILHAVGPGHGKAVVSTFLLTQPSGYRSALSLAVGGALLQGVSAVIWVGVTLGMMQWLIRESVGQVIWAERFSYLLISAVGGYIVWREWRRARAEAKSCHCCGHHHDHHHEHHNPSRRSLWLAMLAIGIRPCSGSILALAVAASWHLWGVGIAMTLAISCGTAVTVLALALLTVFGRAKVARRITANATGWRQAFRFLVMLGAGALIILGLLLFSASFNAPSVGLLRV